MSAKPKLAVCLSGQPRTWRHCLASQERLLQNFDVDYYLHNWDECSAVDQVELMTAYAPVTGVFEARPDFSAQQRALIQVFPKNPLVHVFDMAYGVKRALELAFEAKRPYDYYARMRYDLLFEGVLDPSELVTNAIHTFDWGHPSCTDDMFAMGTKTQMRTYAGFYDWIVPDQIDREPYDGLFKPERALRVYLDSHNQTTSILKSAGRKLLRPRMVGRDYGTVRDDIFGQVEKHNIIDARIREITTPDDISQVVFYHPYRDGLPVHAMQDRIRAVCAMWTEEERQMLFFGPWQDRLRLAERIYTLAFAQVCDPNTLSREAILHARLMATVLLSQMDLSIPLDHFGVVLTSLSFERVDGVMSEQWISAHPIEAAGLLVDPDILITAPCLIAILSHLTDVVKQSV